MGLVSLNDYNIAIDVPKCRLINNFFRTRALKGRLVLFLQTICISYSILAPEDEETIRQKMRHENAAS